LLDNARGGLPMAFERTCVHKDIPAEGLGVSGGELVGALGTSSRTVGGGVPVLRAAPSGCGRRADAEGL
jgi:hypothetical protein